MRLKDRVAIVTGGGYGIGHTYFLAIAREGRKVVIADINDQAARKTAQAIRTEGGEALAVHTDVSEPASVTAMVQAAVERYGRVNILVNNAPYFAALSLRQLEDITVEEWDRVMGVNLRRPFLCIQAVVSSMKRQAYGKIVNISSSSIQVGNPLRIHYVTSKARLIGFTRSLAPALGDCNMCVNSLLPGRTASEGTINAYGEAFFERGRASRSIKRVEKPEGLLGTLVYLCSSDSDFVTRQGIVVDGGASIYLCIG